MTGAMPDAAISHESGKLLKFLQSGIELTKSSNHQKNLKLITRKQGRRQGPKDLLLSKGQSDVVLIRG